MIEWLSAAIALGGAVYAVGARHLMRGVLGLAIAFVGVAGLFGAMGAWYLAAGQVFLFVGGVVTLFVLAFSTVPLPIQKSEALGAAAVAVAALVTLAAMLPRPQAGEAPQLAALAADLFLRYGLVVNAALLLLLAALLGAHYLMEDEA